MRPRPTTREGAPLAAVLMLVVAAVTASQLDALHDAAALLWGVALLLLVVAAPFAVGYQRRRRRAQD